MTGAIAVVGAVQESETCPSDAVVSVKSAAHIILTTKGGHGCIREFIDAFLLNEPIS